jgi:hypothetical protein
MQTNTMASMRSCGQQASECIFVGGSLHKQCHKKHRLTGFDAVTPHDDLWKDSEGISEIRP